MSGIELGGVFSEGRKKSSWLKRLGVAGFLFFLGKGLLWVSMAAGAWTYRSEIWSRGN
jgi:hypothetical protein